MKEPPTEWIPLTIVTLISTVITGRILITEIQKRKDKSIKFTTRQFKIWSIVCIGFCFGIPLSLLLGRINVFCIFGDLLALFSVFVVELSMGFYQLSR